MYKKLKSYIADDLVFTSLLLCGVAVAAFILGRASVVGSGAGAVNPVSLVRQTDPPPVLSPVTQPGATFGAVGEASVKTEASSPASIVASKSGTKYHLVSCPGAKQIKDENKVYFASPAEAEAAGYSKASNCPGL